MWRPVSKRGGLSGWRVGVLAIAIWAGCTQAVAAAGSASEQLPIPPGFALEASNGYSIAAVVGEAGGERSNARRRAFRLLLFVSRRGESVLYFTPATYTDAGELRADLGSLGLIDVRFRASGETERDGGLPASIGAVSLPMNER